MILEKGGREYTLLLTCKKKRVHLLDICYGLPLASAVSLAGQPHLHGEVPKHVLLDLAGGGLGQLSSEDNRSGYHVLRHVLPAPRSDVGRGHRARRIVLEADKRARCLAS